MWIFIITNILLPIVATEAIVGVIRKFNEEK